MTRGWSLLAGPAAAAGAVLVVAAPLGVVLSAKDLTVIAILTTGTWVSVRRLGVADLSTAASAGVGAYAGAVAPALAGVPVALGWLLGAIAAGAFSALVVAVTARTGRTLGALVTLTAGAVTVSGLATIGVAGGAAGFHAVPLVTGSDRGDLAVLLALLAGVLACTQRWSRSRHAATAATAARAPDIAASLGRRPVIHAASGGAVAGVILGLGGAAGGVASGSVFPGAYDVSLAVALVLAALLGGGQPVAGTLGAVLVWGPSAVWPTVGDTTLLGTGLVALAFLVVRPRGVLPPTWAAVPEGPPSRPVPRRLPDDLPLDVQPREVVGVAGRNGAGKSMLLAQFGGQLDGRATRRARGGVARTWQHPPDLPHDDALAAAIEDEAGAAAAAWATELLGEQAATAAGADLVRLAARRPGLALLDEPAAHLRPDVVAGFVRALADGGAAVIATEHRRHTLATCDRVVELPLDRRTANPAPPHVTTRGPAPIAVADVAARPGEALLVDADVAAALRGGRGTLGGRALPASVHAQVRRGLAIVGPDDPVAADVSIGDHLGALGARGLVERAPLLVGRADEPAGVLSGGERRVLSWCRAIATRPRAVLLDRAGTGLDATSLRWAAGVVAAWRQLGVPVLVHAGRPEETAWAAGTVHEAE